MKLRFIIIPDDIIEKYNLISIVAEDGFIYIRIHKGMYGLKEAAILAYDQLAKFLNADGYHHIIDTAGMWKHKTNRTAFVYASMTLA